MAVVAGVVVEAIRTAFVSLTATGTTDNAVPANSFIVIGLGFWCSTGATTITFSCGGLTWTQDKKTNNGSDNVAQFSAQAPAGLAAGTTWTATSGVTSSDLLTVGRSFTGVATPTVVESTGSATPAAGTAWNTGALSPNPTAGNLLTATMFADGTATTSTPPTGWTEASDISDAPSTESITLVYLLSAPGGAVTPAGSWAASNASMAGVGVAYTAAGAAAPTVRKIPTPRAAVFRSVR
jgi:hypothetical protein